jgi:hypothetical protein
MIAGAAASTAYLAEMAVDMRLTGNRYDDLILWGGFLSRIPRRQRLLGALVHYGVGTGLAVAYQMIQPLLPGAPGWIRGALFAQVESAILFPTLVPMNAVHPAVQRGELPQMWGILYFNLEVLRHLAYGITLGLIVDEAQTS